MNAWSLNPRLCASPLQKEYECSGSSPTLSLSSSHYSDASYDSSSSHGSVASSTTSLSSSSTKWLEEVDCPPATLSRCSKADAASIAHLQSQAERRKALSKSSPQCDDSWTADFVAKRCSAAQNGHQNPRRAGFCPTRVPPTLVRQGERREDFVEQLVDTATVMVSVIWPNSMVPAVPGVDDPKGQVLPLRMFIKETLKRSRTSYSTLQVAMYYLILIKSKANLPRCDFTMEQSEDSASFRAMQCGRRMFLAALILASKYLQDRNYSARAWSKISGLKIHEINSNEVSFLAAVEWKLHISDETFSRWTDIVTNYTHSMQWGPRVGLTGPIVSRWKALVKNLTPSLEFPQTIWVKPASSSQATPDFDMGPEPLRKSSPIQMMPEGSPSQPSPNNARPCDTQILRPPPTPLLNSHLTTPVISPTSTSSSTPGEAAFNYSSMPPPLRRMQSDARLKNRSINYSAFTSIGATPTRARTFNDAVAYTEPPQTVIGPQRCYPDSRNVSRRPSFAEMNPSPMSSRKSSIGSSDQGIVSLLQAAKELDWSAASSPCNYTHSHKDDVFEATPIKSPSLEGGLLSPPSSNEHSPESSPPRPQTSIAVPKQPTEDTVMASPAPTTTSSRRKRRHNLSTDLGRNVKPSPAPRSSSTNLHNGVRLALSRCPSASSSLSNTTSATDEDDDMVIEDAHRATTFVLRSRDATFGLPLSQQSPPRDEISLPRFILGRSGAGRGSLERGWARKRACCA